MSHGGRIFLSTPSARRATSRNELILRALRISIHALREEGDAKLPQRLSLPPEFLSTPSARRATIVAVHHAQRNPISIHALREEGDPMPP